MTKGFYIAVLVVYTLCLALIAIYAIIQLNLALNYQRKKWKKAKEQRPELSDLPAVTVQLPVFNERYVIERLIKSVAALDYPVDKLEIQVLDDSTDESFDIAAKLISELQNDGIDIKHIQRKERTGFKAGALQYGLESAKGEYIAIFDADFMPKPNFLKELLPYFDEDRIGMVQARWGHLNESFSILTKVQAFHLNNHFTTEQQGRCSSGLYMNFNGTGGVWRKECIVDAGGWEADTLTEDLDLSYRAQLKGWKFHFTEDVEAPAELPAAMSAIRSQQYRWMKGSSEVARKHLSGILRRNDVPLRVKLHSAGHLLGSSVFFLVLILIFFSLPLILLRHSNMGWFPDWFMSGLQVLKFTFFAFLFIYLSTLRLKPGKWVEKAKYFITTFPSFLCIISGLSYHNSSAVLEGFIGKRSDFIRTPKFNIISKENSWSSNVYLKRKLHKNVIAEFLIFLYISITAALSIYWGFFDMLPFLLLVGLGFGFILFFSIKHHRIASLGA